MDMNPVEKILSQAAHEETRRRFESSGWGYCGLCSKQVPTRKISGIGVFLRKAETVDGRRRAVGYGVCKKCSPFYEKPESLEKIERNLHAMGLFIV